MRGGTTFIVLISFVLWASAGVPSSASGSEQGRAYGAAATGTTVGGMGTGNGDGGLDAAPIGSDDGSVTGSPNAGASTTTVGCEQAVKEHQILSDCAYVGTPAPKP